MSPHFKALLIIFRTIPNTNQFDSDSKNLILMYKKLESGTLVEVSVQTGVLHFDVFPEKS